MPAWLRCSARRRSRWTPWCRWPPLSRCWTHASTRRTRTASRLSSTELRKGLDDVADGGGVADRASRRELATSAGAARPEHRVDEPGSGIAWVAGERDVESCIRTTRRTPTSRALSGSQNSQSLTTYERGVARSSPPVALGSREAPEGLVDAGERVASVSGVDLVIDHFLDHRKHSRVDPGLGAGASDRVQIGPVQALLARDAVVAAVDHGGVVGEGG